VTLRVLGWALTAAAGALASVATVAVHDKSWAWWCLAVGAPVATALALRPGGFRASFVAGWLLVLFLAVLGRPEGDFAVSATPRGYGLLLAGMLLLALAVATVRGPRRTAT
jgi:hypothetical protein